MAATATRTMTIAQMNWNLRNGFAWFERDADGNVCDDWRSPIWTKDGGWMFDNSEAQVYELLI